MKRLVIGIGIGNQPPATIGYRNIGNSPCHYITSLITCTMAKQNPLTQVNKNRMWEWPNRMWEWPKAMWGWLNRVWEWPKNKGI